MELRSQLAALNGNLSLYLPGLLTKSQAQSYISMYQAALNKEAAEWVEQEIIKDCEKHVFTEEINTLLTTFYQGKFKVMWPRFDVVSSASASEYPNVLWHLDYGIPNTLKLFLYLNPVSEHHGNTLMLDDDTTEQLRTAGYLPVETEKRVADIQPALTDLGLEGKVKSFDLQQGDGFLFSPLKLAHCCQLPKTGHQRYTVCFNLIPPL